MTGTRLLVVHILTATRDVSVKCSPRLPSPSNATGAAGRCEEALSLVPGALSTRRRWINKYVVLIPKIFSNA